MRVKTKNHKICSTCIHAVKHSKECHRPNLSPDVFSYVRPAIENADALRYVFAGIDRETLRTGEAPGIVAFRAATYTGQCKMYEPNKTQRHEPD